MKLKPNYLTVFSIIFAVALALAQKHDQGTAETATWIVNVLGGIIASILIYFFLRTTHKAELARISPSVPINLIPSRVMARLPYHDDWEARVEKWGSENGYVRNPATTIPNAVFFQKKEGLQRAFIVMIAKGMDCLELKCWMRPPPLVLSADVITQIDQMPGFAYGVKDRKAEVSKLAAAFEVPDIFGRADNRTPYGLIEDLSFFSDTGKYRVAIGLNSFFQLIAMLCLVKWCRELAYINFELRVAVSFLIASMLVPFFILARMPKTELLRVKPVSDMCMFSITLALFAFANFWIAKWATIEFEKLLYTSFLPAALVAFVLHKLVRPFAKSRDAGAFAVIVFAGMFGVIWALNIVYDFSAPRNVIVGKLGKFSSDKGLNPRFEVTFDANINTLREDRLSAEYVAHMKEGEPVAAKEWNGLFGIKWIGKSYLERYSSIDTFLHSLKSEQEILHNDVLYMWKAAATSPEESKKYTELASKWIETCKKSGGYSCRLASYVASSEKENRAFLRRGCDDEDQHSCFNLYLYKALSDEEKNNLIGKAKADCDSGNIPQCFYYGQYLNEEKKTKEAIGYIHKACEIEYLNACVTEQQLKDMQ